MDSRGNGTCIDSLLDRPGLVHLERLPARPPCYAEPDRPVPSVVREAFGFDRLWSHQAHALDLVRRGASVAIATGTASGKSLCYQVPIAEAVTSPSPATALIITPTKALAHDQHRSLGRTGLPGLVAGCYDGDSTRAERSWIRRNANVLLTNPEMLHHSILPGHPRWATFLMRLRFVVVDELHTHRGLFGSHTGHLLRRLRRLCAHYGSDPTFVTCSATVGEPGRLASELTGVEMVVISDDGSPRAPRTFALWDPLCDGTQRGGTRGISAELVAELVGMGRRTIAFCRSRTGTEIVAARARKHLSGLTGSIRAYRGGYRPEERRRIEQQLVDGELLGVVATTALELGVDVGGLDACILDGYPGTISSMWQQVGRVGRAGQEALAILVAGTDQLDRYLLSHPDEVFTRSPEPAVVNLANPYVLEPQLACAAYELPLSHDDERFWPGLLDEGVRHLALDGHLRIRRPRLTATPAIRPAVAVWSGEGIPSHRVSLRGGSGRELRIVDEAGGLVGTVDEARAMTLVHEKAIYLHQGQAWEVIRLDIGSGLVQVTPHDGGEYTVANRETEIRVLAASRARTLGAGTITIGDVEVVSRVTGYARRNERTGELIGRGSLDLPPTHLVTRAFWMTVPPRTLSGSGIEQQAWPGALHAAEHVTIAMLPLFTICDRWDVGGVSTALQGDTGLPSVFVYDGHAGGAGIAELGFDAAEDLLGTALEVVTGCPCDSGCPSCVQSPKCGNGNEPLDKPGALALLGTLLAA